MQTQKHFKDYSVSSYIVQMCTSTSTQNHEHQKVTKRAILSKEFDREEKYSNAIEFKLIIPFLWCCALRNIQLAWAPQPRVKTKMHFFCVRAWKRFTITAVNCPNYWITKKHFWTFFLPQITEENPKICNYMIPSYQHGLSFERKNGSNPLLVR